METEKQRHAHQYQDPPRLPGDTERMGQREEPLNPQWASGLLAEQHPGRGQAVNLPRPSPLGQPSGNPQERHPGDRCSPQECKDKVGEASAASLQPMPGLAPITS